jgi:hypothetical protein
MHHYSRPSLLLIALVLSASCSETNSPSTPTQPARISKSTLVVEAASPTVARPVDNPFCPSVAPFNVPMSITVRITGSSTAVINQIRSQFTDSTGRQAPQVTLPMLPVTLFAPGPTMRFGLSTSELLVRTFTFNPGIGCGTGNQGTAVVTVDASDDTGRHLTQQVRVAVR